MERNNDVDHKRLEIKLAVSVKQSGEVVILLSFFNRKGIWFWKQNQRVLRLPFSNKCKWVERNGLEFYYKGKRIRPFSALAVNPKQMEAELHDIESGTYWSYSLSGTLSDGELKFPGATYRLIPGAKYKIYFAYFGQKASLTWRIPIK